ncbi:MAG TPA: Hsp70 family protein, partial [Myxococcaceae bacterium]|nr:Hsp70 family protein [Myxococcaceae bacterium]
ELKNKAENMAYQMEKLVKENGDKIAADSKKALEEAIAEVNKVRDGQDKAALQAAVEKLEKASHKAAEEMYKAAGAAGNPPPPGADGPSAGAGPGSQATPKKDDVVDAEFRTN